MSQNLTNNKKMTQMSQKLTQSNKDFDSNESTMRKAGKYTTTTTTTTSLLLLQQLFF